MFIIEAILDPTVIYSTTVIRSGMLPIVPIILQLLCISMMQSVGGKNAMSQENVSVSAEDFHRFQEAQQPPATNNVDVNQLLVTMQMMMQQNATMLQMLAANQNHQENTRNYTVVPDFSKTIQTFSGEDLSVSRNWLDSVESAAMLHRWPAEFTLETARSKLTSAASHWYKARVNNILTWDNFKTEFTNTFIHENNLTSLWKKMNSRVQGPKEDLSIYFHDKVRLSTELHLSFEEQKEQIAIGLMSREMASMVMTKTYLDIDDLYHDLIKYERVSNERRSRHTNIPSSRKPHVPGKDNQQILSSDSKRNLQSLKKPIRCFNCFEEGHIVTSCTKPKREKGSCFTCGSMQHKQKDCPKNIQSTQSVSERSPDSSTNLVDYQIDVVPSYQIQAILEVDNRKLNITPILDTGSPISLIIDSLVPDFSVQKNVNVPTFHGINSSALTIIGKFKSNLIFNDLNLEMDFYVVPKNTMKYECLLGRDFIAKHKLNVTLGEDIKVKIESKINDNYSDIPEIFLIDVPLDINDVELDINPQIEPKLRLEFIKNFHQNYLHAEQPEKPKIEYEMKIDVKVGHKPFFFRPRRLSFYEKNKVNEIIEDLLNKNIIRKSTSEYSSPIVLVSRKPSGLRMCVDYRELNKITTRDNFPLPLIDDQIDKLRDKYYFTHLDLKDAFHHVTISAESVKYTSFVTHSGQYEYLKAPFGLKNCPANFSRYINLIFRDLIDQGKVSIYIDDILIATDTLEENIKILGDVFKLLVENKLELKLSKCSFFKNEIQFLGYVISKNGVKPCQTNIEAVSKFPIPRNFKDVQSFLGLTSYFRRFIKNYALIAKPLYDLLKKDSEFKFNEDELHAFETLKSLLIREPILAIFNPHAETQLHCDASSHGFGSILMQKQNDGKFHPIFYFSKRTSPTESKYHSYELEMMCIVNSLKRFRVYLQGLEFKIITDCNSIKLALQKKEINNRILRWSLELQNYSYTIEHRSNKQMTHADCLSRNSILILEDNTFERNLSIKQDQDKEISQIRDSLENSESKFFEIRNGLVYRKFEKKLLFYVPETMEASVIKTYHDEIGHVGENKTCELIMRTYWFPHLKQKIKNYISNCLKCISYSPASGKPEGYLNSIPKGNLPFQTIHIDHYGPLEKTRYKHKYILVTIDAFTKFVKLFPCNSTDTKTVVKHLNCYFRYYSKPVRVISDRGTCFTSNEFKKFMEEQDINHILIATGVPRANGQVEVVNKTITAMCSKLSEDTDRWDEILEKVEFSINNTINRSTGQSPSMLLFGIHQKGHVQDNLRTFVETQNLQDRNLALIREKASDNILKCQDYSKTLYDKRHKDSNKYQLGDYVMIINTDVTPGSNKKLIPKYRGPYVVKAVLDNDRYVVGDIEGFQVTQIPFEGVMAPSRMKPWMENI